MYICIVNKIYYVFTMAAISEKEIYLAGGCFWGTEHYFKQIEGVVETEVGYANGITENPTYEQVCTDGKPDVEKMGIITYDPVHHTYIKFGNSVGHAFADGKQLK